MKDLKFTACQLMYRFMKAGVDPMLLPSGNPFKYHVEALSVQYNGGLLPDIVLLTQCYYHRETRLNAMCVCCVLFPFILDIKFVGRTSRGHTGGRSHRFSHPPSFCGACLNFSREKDSAIIPFPRRP